MISYDKLEIRESLTLDNIYDILQSWGGEPESTPFGIISATICHNEPGVGSKKLYYYENTKLFKCFTGCDDVFDIFDLTIKVFRIQKKKELNLNDAVRYVAYYFGILGTEIEGAENEELADWEYFSSHKRENKKIEQTLYLKEYNDSILSHLNYKVKLTPWLDEGIAQDILNYNKIGFFPGGDQITIPHYDIDGRFIGLRGRSLCAAEAEAFGKYRPLRVGNSLYNHPLGFNLYGIDKAKDNIKLAKTAIIVESEKSVLKYQTYFGVENNVMVACCGSSVSAHQIHLLLSLGAQEIIIGFDRQFQTIGDTEFKHLKNNLLSLHRKYNSIVKISFIFDKKMITGYKSSPIDEGKEKFIQLLNERIYL